jgi:hypothetical protein
MDCHKWHKRNIHRDKMKRIWRWSYRDCGRKRWMLKKTNNKKTYFGKLAKLFKKNLNLKKLQNWGKIRALVRVEWMFRRKMNKQFDSPINVESLKKANFHLNTIPGHFLMLYLNGLAESSPKLVSIEIFPNKETVG